MHTILHDIRYAARQLRRNTAFSIAAVLTIALGIGVNVALFSVGSELLFRARPGVNNASDLVWVTPTHKLGYTRRLAYPDFVEIRDHVAPLAELAASDDASFSLSGNGAPEIVYGELVTGNYFALLQTPMALGRSITPADDANGADGSIAVISYALWSSRFQNDSAIVGRSIRVNGRPVTVVGIAPDQFNGENQTEHPRALWFPMSAQSQLFPGRSRVIQNREFTTLTTIARLRNGVSSAQLQSMLSVFNSSFVAVDSANRTGLSLRIYSAATGFPPGSERTILPVALAASAVTALILLIAFANVSNLLLGRGLSRKREIAIRLSLGASRARLIRQLVTENVVLTAVGGGVGVILALWCVDLVLTYAVPVPLTIHFDWHVLAFTGGVTLATGIVFGLIPAFDATRTALSGSMNGASYGANLKHRKTQDNFVVAQTALALTLLIMSGLFLRSVTKAQDIELGFDTSNSVVAAQFDLGLQGYTPERSGQFLDELVTRATAHPAVQSASVTTILPSTMFMQARVFAEGLRSDSTSNGVNTSTAMVRPDYFKTIGIIITQGRDFNRNDALGAPAVAIVSERLAKRVWPKQNPVGARFATVDEPTRFFTVVGVVKDIVVAGVQSGTSPMIYTSQYQAPYATRFTLLVRSSGNASVLAPLLRADVKALDADISVSLLETLDSVRDRGLLLQRRGSNVLAIFGALALLLAAIGVNGVMAFAVAQRTKEIGVRMALGAEPLRVVRMIVARGMKLALTGTTIGVVLSLALGRLLSSMLFGITPADVLSYAGGSVVLCAVALLACWLPARKAANVNPIVALRQD